MDHHPPQKLHGIRHFRHRLHIPASLFPPNSVKRLLPRTKAPFAYHKQTLKQQQMVLAQMQFWRTLDGDDYSLLTTWTIDHCTPIYHYSEIPINSLFIRYKMLSSIHLTLIQILEHLRDFTFPQVLEDAKIAIIEDSFEIFLIFKTPQIIQILPQASQFKFVGTITSWQAPASFYANPFEVYCLSNSSLTLSDHQIIVSMPSTLKDGYSLQDSKKQRLQMIEEPEIEFESLILSSPKEYAELFSKGSWNQFLKSMRKSFPSQFDCWSIYQ